MKAIVINEAGAPDVLTPAEIATPEPKENEVRIKLAFAALNHVDVWARLGNPAYQVKFPHVLGADGAGTVDALGPDAEGVSVGDRVLVFPGLTCGVCSYCRSGHDNQCDKYEILGTRRNGTYAEYVVVPDLNVIAIPDEMVFEYAAAFPLAYLTAWHMLFGRAQLKASETVLIIGAGSGIGAAAIQLAKLKGAKVLAATSSRHKVNKLKSLGADDVFLEEKDSDFSRWAIKSTDGRGVDVVFEHVGPATWEKSVKSLGKCGRLVTCGATTGPTTTLDLRYVFSRDLSILGARMGTQKEFRELSAPVFSNQIVPVVDKVFYLDDAVSAHNYLEGKQQIGKILLKIS